MLSKTVICSSIKSYIRIIQIVLMTCILGRYSVNLNIITTCYLHNSAMYYFIIFVIYMF